MRDVDFDKEPPSGEAEPEFDPDAFLAEPSPEFDPDAFLAEPEIELAPLIPVAESVESENRSRRHARLRLLHGASLSDEPEKEGRVLRLSSALGVSSGLVRERVGEYSKVQQEGEFDPERFEREQPELAEKLAEVPDLKFVMRDEEMTRTLSALRGMGAVEKEIEKREEGRSWWENLLIGVNPVAALREVGAATAAAEESGELAKAVQPRKRALLQDEATRAFAAMPAAERAFLLPIARYAETKMQMGVNEMYAELHARRTFGLDTLALETRIHDAELAAVPRDYGEGATGVMVDVAEALASMAGVYKKAGVAAAVGGVATGVVAGIATRSPKEGLKWAKRGGAVFGKAGMAYGSLVLATGGTYKELLGARTDAGEPVSEEEARGGALIIGAAEAGVETASNLLELRFAGRSARAILGGGAKELMKEAGFRALAVRVARAMARKALPVGKEGLKSMLVEGTEEALQEVIGDVGNYATRWKAGGAPPEGPVIEPGGWLVAAKKGALGGVGGHVVITGGMVAAEAVLSPLARDLAARATSKAKALAEMKPTAAVQAMAEHLADVIEKTTASSGEAMTHASVDAEAFVRHYEGDLGVATEEQARGLSAKAMAGATEMLGPDGPRLLAEALATGGRLEVASAQYLAKWSGTETAKALVPYTSDRPGRATEAEVKAQDAGLEAKAQELAKQLETEPPTETAELAFVDALEQQLAQRPGYDKGKARTAVVLHRAVVRTAASVMGKPAAELFGDMAVEMGVERPATSAEEARRFLVERLARTPSVARGEELFLDTNTRLLNEAGFAELPAPPDKPLVLSLSVEGIKYVNDKVSHEKADLLYRAVAVALSGIDPTAAKVGGDFALHVKDEAEAEGVLRRVREVMPEQLRGFAITGKTGATLEAAQEAHVDFREGEELAGRRAKPRPRLPGGKPEEFGPPERPFGVTVEPAEIEIPETQAKVSVPEILQAQIAGMSDEQYFKKGYQDETGAWTALGWKLLPHRAATAALDLKGLAVRNALFGRQHGDLAIRRLKQAAMDVGGAEFDFAHLHGDEFAAQHDDPAEMKAFLVRLRKRLEEHPVEYPDPATGDWVLDVVEFHHGLGAWSYDSADRDLNRRKSEAAQGAGKDSGGPPREDDGAGKEGPAQGAVDVGRGGRAGSERAGGGGAGGYAEGDWPFPYGGEVAAGGPRLEAGTGVSAGVQGKAPAQVEIGRQAGQRLIQIFLHKDANLSSFLHESGRAFLLMLGDLAALPDAPERIRNDWATALKALGVAPGAAIEKKHQEQWADWFESYLMRGEAPSPVLVRPFESFRLWLVDVYRQVFGFRPEINEDIRGVFDRLLATDEEIESSKQAMGPPMWRTLAEALAAGLSPDDAKAYLDDQVDATANAAPRARVQMLKERLRAQEAWWKEQEAALRKAALVDYEGMRAVRAKKVLKVVDLDVEAVRAAVGVTAAKGFHAVKDGANPDEFADLLGYANGDEMLKAVAALPDKAVWAEQEARRLMELQHPDTLEERGALRAEIAKGLHGDFTAKWLLRELKVLRAKAGEQGEEPPIETIERAAQIITEKKLLARLDAGSALRQERAAADKAMGAAAKGDFPRAVVFKQRQILNMFLYRELVAAQKEREAFLDLAAALRKTKARARLGKASPVYRDGVDLILEAFALKEPVDRDEPLASLGEVVSAMQRDGAAPIFDPIALGVLLAKPRSWKQMSIVEMRLADAALRNIRAAARGVASTIFDYRLADQDAVATELVAEARRNLEDRGPAIERSAMTTLELAGAGWNSFSGSVLKMETMVLDMLGGGDLRSAWFRAVIKPMQDAKAREVDILRAVVKPIIDTFDAMPAAVRSRFMEPVDGRALFPNHLKDLEPPRWRYELLMMAFNAGNESNLQRLLDGRNITLEELHAALNLLTKEEVAWVQSVLDAAESLWPEASALEERDSGLAPKKIKPVPFRVAGGSISGYFPAVYAREVEIAGERQVAAQALADLFDPSYTRPGTSHGHLKSRVEKFAGAISLEPGAISRHLAQVAHDIAFREVVKSVGGLFLRKDIKAVLRERLGDGRARQFLLWVKDIGRMRGVEEFAHAAMLFKIARTLKANTVIAALGYSIPNAIEDLSNLPAALAATDLKARHLAAAMAELAGSPVDVVAFVESKSGEMRTHRDVFRRELIGRIGELTAVRALKPIRYAKEHAFAFMEFSSKYTSTPIWLGAYRQALAKGENDADAVTFADSVVRKVFPSLSVVDAAAIVRDRGVVGTMLIFYGFFSSAYNNNARLLHRFGRAETAVEKAKLAGQMLAYLMAFGVLSEFLRGRGREEDEDWGLWFLRKMFAGSLSTLPFGGDIANFVEGGLLGKRINPRATSFAAIGVFIYEMALAAGRDEDPIKLLGRLFRASGPLHGLPVSQPARTLGYALDVAEGEIEPRGPFDVAGGLLLGEKKKQPANPFTLTQDIVSGD